MFAKKFRSRFELTGEKTKQKKLSINKKTGIKQNG